MRKIIVSDVTLRTFCEENSFTFREKLNAAQFLDTMGVDCIELPAICNDKEDSVICRTIAGAMKNARVCIASGDSKESLAAAWDCVKDSKDPCIQVIMPVSTVQMEYMYHLKAPKMVLKIAELCKCASELGCRVEFVAQDASRAEEGFIAQCCAAAQENGASAITVCDDSGIYFPEDYAKIVKEIKECCSLEVYVQPSNALKMAAASAVEAIKAGADGIKTSISDDYLSAEVLADIFRIKAYDLGTECGLDVTAIHNMSAKITGNPVTGITAAAAPEAESASIDASFTVSDLTAYIKELGYELSDEDNGKVYEEFKRVISKKSVIETRELEAIIASAAMQVPSTFHVSSFVVNSGNIITATAHVTLEKNGEKLSGVSTGDGPIDAAFHAIEQIVGHHYELDDFQINSITKGREAVGSSLIRLRANDGKLYSGTGVSTDIIGACIRAYVNALNKIVYEED